MKKLLLFVMSLFLLGSLYGCSGAALQSTDTPVTAPPTDTAGSGAGAAAPTRTEAGTAAPTSTEAASSSPTWVPPTALAGTPIPGAEATLTAAPRLNTETITFTNSLGEQINMTAEIAGDEPSRELGLMFRSSMPPDHGMIFDFQQDTTSGFWMANTILPLSIAFVQADGKIISVQDMQPLDRTGISAPGPYRYAIEANQGYYAAHNIAAGDTVSIPGSGAPEPTPQPTQPQTQSALIPNMPACTK